MVDCWQVLVNTVILLILAVVGVLWSQPLFHFLVCVQHLYVITHLITIKDLDDYKKINHAPLWYDILFYVSIISVYVFSGHWMMGFSWFIICSIDIEKRRGVADGE